PDPAAGRGGQARLLRWIHISAGSGAPRGPAGDGQDPDQGRPDPAARLHGGDGMSVQRHEVHLLTGGYALDALTDDERADFERHLARCPSCAEEARGLGETAARLALATAVAPPPELRARVLTAALQTRQLPPPGRGPLARAGEHVGRRRRSLKRAGLTAGILTLAAAVAA